MSSPPRSRATRSPGVALRGAATEPCLAAGLWPSAASAGRSRIAVRSASGWIGPRGIEGRAYLRRQQQQQLTGEPPAVVEQQLQQFAYWPHRLRGIQFRAAYAPGLCATDSFRVTVLFSHFEFLWAESDAAAMQLRELISHPTESRPPTEVLAFRAQRPSRERHRVQTSLR